jgi:hypothetical protein
LKHIQVIIIILMFWALKNEPFGPLYIVFPCNRARWLPWWQSPTPICLRLTILFHVIYTFVPTNIINRHVPKGTRSTIMRKKYCKQGEPLITWTIVHTSHGLVMCFWLFRLREVKQKSSAQMNKYWRDTIIVFIKTHAWQKI